MTDCIFCRIVAGNMPAHKVYEDEHLLAFMDIFPAEPGHTLLIPKAHAENLFEMDAAGMAAVGAFSVRLAAAIRMALQPDGLMVFQLNGAAAGQTVFHYHMHFLPRHHGSAPALHGRTMAQPDELAAMAGRIRAALEMG